MTLRELACSTLGYVEQAQKLRRGVYTLRPGTPEWVKELFYDASPDLCCDDFVCRGVYFFLEQISQGLSVDLDTLIIEYELNSLTEWMLKSKNRVGYVNNILRDENSTILDVLIKARRVELKEIYANVLRELQERNESFVSG